MKITASETVIYKDIEISKLEQKRIVLESLYKIYNWNDDYILKDDKILEVVEYRTSHSYYVDEFVRNATDDDFEAEKVIKKVKQFQF